MAQASAYRGAYNRLELDGSDVGSLRSVEGGDPYGEVVQVAVGAGSVPDKRIAAFLYSDIAIECGLVPSGPLADWIGATLGGTFSLRHGGAIVEHDQNLKETSRLAFREATIHEVEFPAMDASRQDPIHLTVRLAPEWTQRQAGSGAVQAKDGMTRGARAKPPRSCDFRLDIDGLDTKRVSEVGPLVVRQVIGEPTVGEVRQYERPMWLEVQDLVVTLPEAADWYAWRDAVIVGGTGPERSGMLEYLSPDSRNVLARIEFSGLGIHSLVRERSEEGAQATRRVRASMYCERLSFRPIVAPPPAAAAPDAPPKQPTPLSRVHVAVPLTTERALARPDFG